MPLPHPRFIKDQTIHLTPSPPSPPLPPPHPRLPFSSVALLPKHLPILNSPPRETMLCILVLEAKKKTILFCLCFAAWSVKLLSRESVFKTKKDKGKGKLVLKGAGTSSRGGNVFVHSTYQTATGRLSPGRANVTPARSKGLTFRAERHFWTPSPILPLLPFEGLGSSPSFRGLRCADRFSEQDEMVAEVQSRRRAGVRLSWTRIVTSRKRLSPPLPCCSAQRWPDLPGVLTSEELE